MEAEEFEQRLRRQPWRTIPPSWRANILAAARASSPRTSAAGAWWKLWALWNEYLWPSPRAWAAGLVIWLVVGVWNFWMDVGLSNHSQPPPMSLHLGGSFRHQQRVMAEILEMDSLTVPPAPRQPSPRSERQPSRSLG